MKRLNAQFLTPLLDPNKNYRFILLLWLSSRILVFGSCLILVPLLSPDRAMGWESLSHWDGEWYLKIATEGYSYVDDGKYHPVAFFPLYPLLMYLLSLLHVPLVFGGVLINNICFLATLLLVSDWLQEKYDLNTARWVVSFIALSPLSFFGSILYTEGVFLLISSATLIAFERNQLLRMTLFGMLVTACRPPGIVMIFALGMAAIVRQQSWRHLWHIALTGLGALSYIAYCWWQFDKPLAFIAIQSAWDKEIGGLEVWLELFLRLLFGRTNYEAGELVWLNHPIAMAIVIIIFALVLLNQKKLGKATPFWTFFVILGSWLVGDAQIITVTSMFGGAWVVWQLRHQVPLSFTFYSFLSLGLILFSGSTFSADRYVYGIISASVAVGLFLAQRPRFGYGALVCSTIILIDQSVQWGYGVLVA